MKNNTSNKKSPQRVMDPKDKRSEIVHFKVSARDCQLHQRHQRTVIGGEKENVPVTYADGEMDQRGEAHRRRSK